MGNKHIVDCDQLFKQKPGHAAARINQDIVVHQNGGGVAVAADAAAATENGNFLGYCRCACRAGTRIKRAATENGNFLGYCPYFDSYTHTPSQLANGGFWRKYAMRSR